MSKSFRFLAPPPIDVMVGTAPVRIEPLWVSSGGHFGYVAAHFRATNGRPAHFVFSGMFGKPADLERAWHEGIEAPEKGPAVRIVDALVAAGKAEFVPAMPAIVPP